MADVYEQNLSQKSSLTVNDFIRVVGSDNVSYKQVLPNVAKIIIENYTGSVLAGGNRSIKDAIGRAVTYTGDIDTPPHGTWTLHAPVNSTGTKPQELGGNAFVILSFAGYTGSTLVYGCQLAVGFGSTKVATRYAGYNTSGATWSAWEVLPTRAEVDALNRNSVLTLTPNTEALANIGAMSARRKGNIVYICGFVQIRADSSVPKDTTLFTIPSGHRPTVTITSMAAKVDSNVISPEIAIVNTNGTVVLHNGTASPANSFVRFSIIYPVE